MRDFCETAADSSKCAGLMDADSADVTDNSKKRWDAVENLKHRKDGQKLE